MVAEDWRGDAWTIFCCLLPSLQMCHSHCQLLSHLPFTPSVMLIPTLHLTATKLGCMLSQKENMHLLTTHYSGKDKHPVTQKCSWNSAKHKINKRTNTPKRTYCKHTWYLTSTHTSCCTETCGRSGGEHVFLTVSFKDQAVSDFIEKYPAGGESPLLHGIWTSCKDLQKTFGRESKCAIAKRKRRSVSNYNAT